MKDFLHLFAFEVRRMRIPLILWTLLQFYLLYQAFDRLDGHSNHPWWDILQLLYFPWLVGLSLMLTSGQCPTHPDSLLRLSPIRAQKITQARIGVVFLGILLPALCAYLIFIAWISLEFETLLVGAQFIFVRLLPLALLAAALGNRHNSLADAVFGFVLLGVVGLLLFGLAYWLRMTFYVEDAALASFVWNSLFLVMASALFILDWCQVDRGIIKPSVFLKRLSVICLLIFLYFGVTFQPSADGYGHVAHTLSVQAEELDIRIQPNQIRFLYPPKQENDGHIIYSRLRPTSEVTANELWFFFGKLEVRGLPPGIGLMAQVEEIEWTSVDRQNLASLVVEQNDSRRATTGRMSPPEITEAQLRRLLWDVSPEEEEEVQFASTRLFSSEYGDDEKFGQQPGSMRMRVRLDLYDFELIRRFPVQEGPTENRLPGGRRILSYFSNNSQPRSISFEFDLLTLHNRMRQPVGTGFESSLQIKVVDTRRNMVLQNLGGGTSNRGNWIPGFSRNPIQKVLGHVHYRADDTHENEIELVFITPVYKGSLHVEVTVDDVRLLPEDKTEEGR